MRSWMSSIWFLMAATIAARAQGDMPKPAYDLSLPGEARIKLAESAAPAEISGNATVYLLERTGYVKVREGTKRILMPGGPADSLEPGADLFRFGRDWHNAADETVCGRTARERGERREDQERT